MDIDRAASSADAVILVIRHETLYWRLRFSLTAATLFSLAESNSPGPVVYHDGLEVSLTQYLASEPPCIYFADLSVLEGRQLTRPRSDSPFDDGQVRVIDWDTEQVDIEVERGASAKGLASIHDYLGVQLRQKI